MFEGLKFKGQFLIWKWLFYVYYMFMENFLAYFTLPLQEHGSKCMQA